MNSSSIQTKERFNNSLKLAICQCHKKDEENNFIYYILQRIALSIAVFIRDLHQCIRTTLIKPKSYKSFCFSFQDFILSKGTGEDLCLHFVLDHKLGEIFCFLFLSFWPSPLETKTIIFWCISMKN